MNTKIVAYYSFFIGISVIAMWLMILLTETPPEGKTEKPNPVNKSFGKESFIHKGDTRVKWFRYPELI